jgi:hypothetical protein
MDGCKNGGPIVRRVRVHTSFIGRDIQTITFQTSVRAEGTVCPQSAPAFEPAESVHHIRKEFSFAVQLIYYNV